MSRSGNIEFSVFTKPWKDPLTEVGKLVSNMGFHTIELPVRPGYQVEPENVTKGLPRAAKILADYGVRIHSVAGPTNEATMAACAEVGVPIIRVLAPIGEGGYMATVARLQREYDTLVSLLDKYGITVAVQNHSGACVCNAMGLHHLLSRYDRKQIGAVWDPAHNALNGEDPEMAIDIVWSHLCMVSLKNAFWRRKNGPEAECAEWDVYWTTGRQGLASWPRVAAELRRRHYQGVYCLHAEHTDQASVLRLLADDLAYARSLFAREG